MSNIGCCGLEHTNGQCRPVILASITHQASVQERRATIPSEDPYEEAAQQLFEQAPRYPEYAPEDHIPVYIPEPEHPEDLLPVEDEAPIPPLPPSFLAPRIRPLSPRALEAEMRDIASSFYHSLHPSGTPPLLPIPLPAPSTSRRADIPEADTPPRKRLLLATPRPGCEIGESSAAAAARQPGPTMAHRVDHSHVDTMETRLRDTERRIMTALELVNRRVTYQEKRLLTSQRVWRLPSGHGLGLRLTAGTLDGKSTVLETEAVATKWSASAADNLASSLYHRVPRPSEAGARLTIWRHCNCSVGKPVKFSTCTLLASALTWWNSHVMTVTHDVAYSMTWVDLRKKMTDKYCPRNEMKKLEAELWNLKVIGMCGLPDMIHGHQLASKPKTMQEAIEMATELMDKRVNTMAERQAENKRKFESTSRNNQNQQQQQNKRQNTGRHTCGYGHIARDCRDTGNANHINNQKGTGSGRKPTCFECGVQGHFQKECPRLKNNKGNRGNQAGNDRAPAKVYVVGNAGANPDNVVAGTFLLNNRYAYILFDTGADRSFVSTAFSSQIDITPSTLDHYYDVELADGRIIGLNTILKGCTLNFLNHQFNINLMPVELGSFDAIIGMDWLAKYQAVIECAEKIVRIPWKNKTLIIHGDGSTQGNVTRLNIISCTKTQKYMEKGFPIFLAHVTTKAD
ncbi:putative reverse transcriptase domain-containing protein [Tanacetum coccineum]|uniref:Reverse transcriptase domain-containing protein n=1 Tax=Tanacetum coccineum TaxID=301880 RepID=A0ABQ4ZU69_9ASTR